MKVASREPSDAGVVRWWVGRDSAQGRGYAPGVGAGANAVVSEAGIRVRECLRRPQPDPGFSLRWFFRICLLLVLGSVSCWFSASAADFRVNPQEIRKGRYLVCFGEQAAKNVLARMIELRTVYKLSREKAEDRLGMEILRYEREEFEDCYVQIFSIYPYEFGIVLDVEEQGIGSWGDLPPRYFVQATVEYKGKWYSEREGDGAKIFFFASGVTVQKVNPADE